MKIKTAELTDAALDWAVDQARGATMSAEDWLYRYKFLEGERYSSDWEYGGPIIEREGLTVGKVVDSKNEWSAESFQDDGVRVKFLRYGPTPLIAAMRCYCASKLGDEVDVPEVLV